MKLLNLRVIDGAGQVIERADIEIEGDSIKSIAASGEHAGATSENPAMQDTLDMSGYTVIPGLFDCHVHITSDASANPLMARQTESDAYLAIMAAKRGQGMLEAGITTARDLGGRNYIEMSVKRVFADGVFPGPRLLVSGRVLTMTGGHGHFFGEEVDGADIARKAARTQIKMGADCIKMMASGGVMTPGVDPLSPSLTEAELRAGFEEAHKAGKLSASHAQATEGIKNAVRAGVRSIEHGIWLDDEAIAMMLERGTFLVPTLAAPKMIAENGEANGIAKYAVDKTHRIIDDHRKSAAAAYKAGVKIACGTDAGTPFNLHSDLYTELELLSQIGMSNHDVIKAATAVSAENLKLNDKLGQLKSGYYADMVLVKGDPLSDLSLLKKPAQVWKAGKQVV